MEEVETTTEEDEVPVFNPREFNKNFDSEAYLRDFYSSTECEPAMKVVIFFFPNLVARIPDGVTVLDIGSGPTVHVPMVFRNKASQVWVSDYATSNRKLLRKWHKRQKVFDWTAIAKYIAQLEGFPNQWQDIEEHARRKVAGVLTCNVLNKKVLKNREDFEGGFDVVTTIFCLEAACQTEQEYRRGFANICKLIKCGGLLMMGGILEENIYQFGGKRVQCFFLTEKILMECLAKAGINMVDGSYLYLHHEGIFVILARKIKQ